MKSLFLMCANGSIKCNNITLQLTTKLNMLIWRSVSFYHFSRLISVNNSSHTSFQVNKTHFVEFNSWGFVNENENYSIVNAAMVGISRIPFDLWGSRATFSNPHSANDGKSRYFSITFFCEDFCNRNFFIFQHAVATELIDLVIYC